MRLKPAILSFIIPLVKANGNNENLIKVLVNPLTS
jgi:hypothetical protein